MGERKGTKGLELWCRRMTEGYPGVNVTNMTTSWRDGLAFCAIIHHFRPDLIEFSKLNKDDIYYNNELAFRVAERHLGIPALLEPEDMVEFPVPDRLSILTYLSQFYQAFVVAQGKSPARIASKRPSSPERGLVSPTSSSPPTKVAFPSAGKVRREPCAKCGLPVFIAERLNVGKLLYHRTCFRCARCSSQLTLANYYETENSEFCCETCPDEEKSFNQTDSSVLTRSLSDEEKSASLKKNEETDDYSANFETALEFPEDGSLKRDSTLNSSQYSKARSFFLGSQVDDDNSDSGNEDEPPDLPKTKPPPVSENVSYETSFCDSGFPKDKLKTNVNIESSVSFKSPSSKLEKSHDIVTKDTISAEGNTNSLVKARMRLFETKSDATNETHSVNNKVPLRKSSSGNLEVGRNNKKDSTRHSFKDNTSKDKDTFEEKHKLPTDIEDRSDMKVEEVSDKINTSMTSDVSETEQSIITISDSTDVKSAEDSVISVSSENTSSHITSTEKYGLETEVENKKEVETDPSLSAIEISDDLSLKHDESTLENKNISDQNKLNFKENLVLQKPLITESPSESQKSKNEDEYPDDLNPFGDEDGEVEEEPQKVNNSNVSLNPFEDEEDDFPAEPSPKPAARKKVKPLQDDKNISLLYVERHTMNPFEEDEDTEEKLIVPQPATRKVVVAPRISLNPFWSEDEENVDENSKPVPKPRFSKTPSGASELKPRESGLSVTSSTSFGSTSSLTSTQSGFATHKKKKPAPKPPSMISGIESGPSSLTSSPSHSVTHSPRSTPKIRKVKKAPLPPTSTPIDTSSTLPSLDAALGDDFENEKFAKDEQNRNRQSQNLSLQSPSSSENSSSLTAPNKSTYGKWKRRKGQAPSRPIPQRRSIKSLPINEVKRELEVIEIQQQGLEKQGVRLEQIIREKCEAPGVSQEESLAPEVEEMVLQLFELVNERNELFRKQAELMYLRRQHKLEEEHADIEYQIRCLMLQPEANKTDSDKAREEELINRLVEIVERRNEIIECLEMDRVREAEEDNSISNQLNLYTMKKEEFRLTEKKHDKKEKKKHKKEKKSKSKGHKLDADKDIDESESSASSHKDKKKKKFNIF